MPPIKHPPGRQDADMPDDLSQVLLARMDNLDKKIDTMQTGVTEALTRLNHPDPESCTQKLQILALQECNLRLFARTEKLEQWRAWMLGGMAILASLWIALITAITQMVKIWKP